MHPLQTHPIWGRPIDDYLATYDLDAAYKRKAVTRKVEAEAAEAIQKLSRLAKQANSATQSTEEITMPTLELIMQLTLSPRTFHHFAHPALVSACVRLLSTIKIEGRSSPFSYEFGYLCFKILIIVVGACILQRSNNLENLTAQMSFETETPLLLIFSKSVAQVVNTRIQMAMSGGPSDRVIDWVEGMGSQRGALVPQSDVHTILSLLWDDRELFFKAYACTYTPGPSGVLFLLWRHLHFERVFNSRPPSPLAVPFCEILWRYMLAFTSDQGDTLIALQRHMTTSGATDVWDASPKIVTLSDLKFLMLMYSDRLVFSLHEIVPSLNIGIIPILLKFLCQLAAARTGAEESYPYLIQRTLERICDTLTSELDRGDFEARFGNAQTILSLLGMLFESMKNSKTYINSHSGQQAVLRTLRVLKQQCIFDLIGRIFIMLRPVSDGRMNIKFSSIFLLQLATTTTKQISAIAPKHIIGPTFEFYIPDWIKFHEHLLYLIHAAPDIPGSRISHLKSCVRVWREISETLGIYNRIEIAQSNPLFCNYKRCPDPEIKAWAIALQSSTTNVNEADVGRSWIDELPQEIIIRVFILGKEMEDSSMHGFRQWRNERQVRFPSLLTQICRKWRSLAIHSPMLWNRIVINSPKSFNYASLFLERSGLKVLLEIEIDIQKCSLSVGREWLAAVQDFYSGGFSDLGSMKDEPKVINQIFDFLIDKGATSSRWVELSVRVASLESLYSVVKLLSTGTSNLDNLHELALVHQRGSIACYQRTSSRKQSETFLFHRPPPLIQTIRLLGIDDHFLFAQTYTSPFSNLITLDFTFIGANLPSLKCIRSVLAHSPRLETLGFNTKGIYATPGFPAWNELDAGLESTVISLPCLHKLSFQDLEHADWGVNILKIIDAPKLEIFALMSSDPRSTGRMDAIASYIAYGTTDIHEDSQSKMTLPYRPVFPILRHLTLIAWFTDSHPVDALVRSLSRVTRVDWIVAIKNSKPPSFDSIFAPGNHSNLEHLRVSGVPADQLIEATKSFARFGTPLKSVKTLNWKRFSRSEQEQIARICKWAGPWTGEVSYDDPDQD